VHGTDHTGTSLRGVQQYYVGCTMHITYLVKGYG